MSWKKISSSKLKDFGITCNKFVHNKTGLQIMQLHDPLESNNSLCLFVQTPPIDSTGCYHILEHSTLDSETKNFPVSNIFFKLNKKSVNSYLNAWTSSDWTAYLLATPNQKDFFNLLTVYLDCIYQSQLTPEVFAQEGHRLQYNPESSSFEIQGVVYNEMKGVFSDSSSYYASEMNKEIFKDTIFANNSGGDPKEIVNLSFEQLVNVYNTYYTPSNSKIIIHGDVDISELLDFLDTKINKIENINIKSTDLLDISENFKQQEKRKRSDDYIEIFGNKDQYVIDVDRQQKLSNCYSLFEFNEENKYLMFVFTVFSLLCFDSPRGVFYDSIIKSNFATDFYDSGFHDDIKLCTFKVSARGVLNDISNREEFQEIINSTFRNFELDHDLFHSIINRILLSLKTQSSEFGILLFQLLISKWNYTDHPEAFLEFSEFAERLKEDVEKNPRFFNNLIEEYFLPEGNSPAPLKFAMNPKFETQKEEQEEEKKIELKRIEKVKSKFSEPELKNIIKSGIQEFESENGEISFAMKEEIENILPKIEVTELSTKILNPIKLKEEKEANIFLNDQNNTNGLTYFSVQKKMDNSIFETKNSKEKLLSPLMMSLLPYIGTSNLSVEELAHLKDTFTGGIKGSTSIIQDFMNPYNFNLGVSLSSTCMDQYSPEMIDLLSQILYDPKFLDQERFEFLEAEITELLTHYSNSIVQNGHSFAQLLASSFLYDQMQLKEEMQGMSFVWNLGNYLEENEISNVAMDLQNLHKKLILDSKTEMKALVTSKTNSNHLIFGSNFARDLKDSKNIRTEKWKGKEIIFPKNEKKKELFIDIGSSINFSAKVIKTGVEANHPDSTKLLILSKLLGSCYFHPKIRIEGGAYGGIAKVGNGSFICSSYRDPHVDRTLDIYDGIAKWIQNYDVSDNEFDEARLEVFQGLDYPLTPHQRGLRLFSNEITNDILQQQRDFVFRVTKDEIIETCLEYFSGHEYESSTVVLGSAIDERFVDFQSYLNS